MATAVCAETGVLTCMEAIAELGIPDLLESVRCLECGEVYAKAVEGGIVQTNPGCPAASTWAGSRSGCRGNRDLRTLRRGSAPAPPVLPG